MKEKIAETSAGVLALLLVPYICTILLNGAENALLNRGFNPELFLPAVVAAEISSDYEMETIKSQAVIARTNFYRKKSSQDSFGNYIKEVSCRYNSISSFFNIIPDVYERAVSETEGKVLTLQGELKLVPYHEISAGKTRDGQEILHNDTYTYLKSVDSSADKKATDYYSIIYIKKSRLPQTLTIEKRDSCGYVTELAADGNIIEGEAFRKGMGLSSSNFTIQETGEKVRFLCRGKGHGLGFSQYGGNELAKNKSTYEEVLMNYFPEMEINDIYQITYE